MGAGSLPLNSMTEIDAIVEISEWFGDIKNDIKKFYF
jgi:hypothetical protein